MALQLLLILQQEGRRLHSHQPLLRGQGGGRSWEAKSSSALWRGSKSFKTLLKASEFCANSTRLAHASLF